MSNSDKINMETPSAEEIANKFGYDRCIVIGFMDGEQSVGAIPFTVVAAYSKVKGDHEKLIALANAIIDGGALRCRTR